MQSLYRKYRPTKLADVVGQSQVTTALENALSQDKIGHAYLFIGPRGTGKTSVARIFAHAINHFDYQLEDSYLDIIEIDAASNNGVDNIRDLREKAIIAPSQGRYKIYIIDEVHMLSKPAFNALLKTLEEPPAHTVFIMATTEADKVPVTITSRTQPYTFRLASPEVITTHLTKIAKQEKINITPDALAIVAERSGGSFRDALSLLDQIASLAGASDAPINADFLRDALGLPSDQMVHDLLNSYITGDLASLQSELQDLLSSGLSPENIAGQLINQILHDPQPALLPLLAKLPDVQSPFSEARLLLALCANVPQNHAPAIPNHADKIANHANTITNHVNTILPQSTEVESPAKNHAPVATNLAPEPANLAPATKNHAPVHKTAKLKSQKSATNFVWSNFLANVRAESSGAADQLQKCQYEYQDGTLHLYPSKKFIAKTLTSPAHDAAIKTALANFGNLALEIHENAKPAVSLSPELSQVAEIMGDVQELTTSDVPF